MFVLSFPWFLMRLFLLCHYLHIICYMFYFFKCVNILYFYICLSSVYQSMSICCGASHQFSSFLFLKRAIPGLFFLYFRLFDTVDNKQMFNIIFCQCLDSNHGPRIRTTDLGFEPRTSGIWSDSSTTWATTTAKSIPCTSKFTYFRFLSWYTLFVLL